MRDHKCLVTKHPVLFNSNLTPRPEQFLVEVAHILPVHHQLPECEHLLSNILNGLTVGVSDHREFNAYSWAVDVDDNYKVIEFAPSGGDPRRLGYLLVPLAYPSGFPPETDALFREHLQQALLKHLKGPGDRWKHLPFTELAVSVKEHDSVCLGDTVWLAGDGKLLFESYLAAALNCAAGEICECFKLQGDDDRSGWPDCRLGCRRPFEVVEEKRREPVRGYVDLFSLEELESAGEKGVSVRLTFEKEKRPANLKPWEYPVILE